MQLIRSLQSTMWFNTIEMAKEGAMITKEKSAYRQSGQPLQGSLHIQSELEVVQKVIPPLKFVSNFFHIDIIEQCDAQQRGFLCMCASELCMCVCVVHAYAGTYITARTERLFWPIKTSQLRITMILGSQEAISASRRLNCTWNDTCKQL